jgi:hypothetical protein
LRSVRRAQRRGNLLHLPVARLRIHRQREHLARSRLGLGAARGASHDAARAGGLELHRHRLADGRGHARGLEPRDEAIEREVAAWVEAPDAAAQASAMQRLQEAAWQSVPFAPTGVFRLRTAFRAELSGVLQGPNPMLWNLRRG